MTPWAQTIGGILAFNGYTDFLANYSVRGAVDPIRRALGLLGASKPDHWQRASDWATAAKKLGLTKTLVPALDRDAHASRQHVVGKLLSNHRLEQFVVDTDDQRLTLRLQKSRRRFATGQEPSTRYRFEVIDNDPKPEDPE